jgi:hypothetical protein
VDERPPRIKLLSDTGSTREQSVAADDGIDLFWGVHRAPSRRTQVE